jgi:hypothetical protein
MKLTIVVLSYNRPIELERILINLSNFKSNSIDLIIKDDCSPKIKEIRELVLKYKKLLKFEVNLHENIVNLGYDLNLKDSFYLNKSDYIFLLSDDDYLNSNSLIKLIDYIDKNRFDVYFTPYFDGEKWNRFSKDKCNKIHWPDIIYNSILFSGLIIKRESFLKLKIEDSIIKNSIYSQVEIVVKILYNGGTFDYAIKEILFLGADGENFFGKNESSNNHELKDRTLFYSNLIYQEYLLKLIKRLSFETSQDIYLLFIEEYKLRLYSYFLKIRSQGIKSYINFIEVYFKSKIIKNSKILFFALIIFFIPKFIAKNILKLGIIFFKKSG